MFDFLRIFDNTTANTQAFYVDYLKHQHEIASLALEIGINKIADVIAKCGFLVESDDAEKAEVEYLLNVRPNKNQLSFDFWKQVIHRQIGNADGCLIVRTNKGIFIADSWQVDDSVIDEKIYHDIRIIVDDNTMLLNKRFKSSDVVHLKYTNPKLLNLLSIVTNGENDLYDVAAGGFKTKAPKVMVSVTGATKIYDAETKKAMTTNEYAEQVAKKMTSNEIKSIVKQSGIDIDMMEGKTTLSSDDIGKLAKNIFSYTAMALGIPLSIFFGDVAQQANSEFITYACEPQMKIIDNGLNAAWLTKDEFIAGQRIMVNRYCVRHIDIIDSAGNMDKLYSNGWSHNDILKVLGLPRVSEEWADERRFTKNYSSEIEGGDN